MERRSKELGWRLVVPVLFALLPWWAVAQDAPDPAAAETSVVEPAPLVRIPAADIARELGTGRSRIREARERLSPRPAVTEIITKLQLADQRLAEFQAGAARKFKSRSSLHNLQNFVSQWETRGAVLIEWRQALASRTQELIDLRSEFRQLHQLWSLTRDALVSAESAAAVLDQVGETLAFLDALDAEIGLRLDAVQTAESKVTTLSVEFASTMDELREAEQRARSNLFAADSLPLWRGGGYHDDDDSLGAQVLVSWQRNSAVLRNFVDTRREPLTLQLLLFATLLVLVLVLKRRSVNWPDDRRLDGTLHILSRPFSTAALITLTLTGVFHPRSPAVIWEVNGLLNLFPVLRVLPGLVFRGLRGPLYGLIAVLLLQQIHLLAVDDSSLERILLLLVTVLGVVGLIWGLRRASSTLPPGRWTRAVTVMARFGLATLGGSLLANLLGRVNLAELLTTATLTSARYALVVFAAVLVLEGLVSAVLRTSVARKLRSVRDHGKRIEHRLVVSLRLVAVAAWIAGTLNEYEILDPLTGVVKLAFGSELNLGTIHLSLGDIVAFVMAILIAVGASRFVRFILSEDVFPRLPLQRGMGETVSMLVNYAILGLGIVVAFAIAGIQLSQLAFIVGALSVGIGFGLQNVVNNFVSGLILIFERPVQIGDTVEVGQLLGRVRRIGIRASVVRTVEGAEVIVPNGNLIASEVVNWTLSDRQRRIDVAVGVAYGTDPNRVSEVLGGVTEDHADVIQHPAPVVLFEGFGASSLDFIVRFWTSNFDDWVKVKSEITHRVNNALVEAGIEIPFPQRDLHVRSIDGPAAGVLGKPRVE